MGAAQRVLVVDGLAETEQVLRAVLEPRGLTVDRVRGSGPEQLAAERRPNVVVLHVEEGPDSHSSHDGWEDVPRILIGATSTAGPALTGAGEHFLEKPFQYGDLIRAIENLLAASQF